MKACKELQWWVDNISHAYKPITHDEAELVIETDSSMMGWGAINLTSNCKTGGSGFPVKNRCISTIWN